MPHRPGLRESWRALLWLAGLLIVCDPAASAALPDTLVRIKPAVVAVGTLQKTRSPAFRFLATGFAVGDGTLIATNAHVLSAKIDEERLETLAVAVVDAAGRSQIRPARKAAADRLHDVGLLSIAGAPIATLPLRETDDVREGETYAFTGFPLGALMGLHAATHRGSIAAIVPAALPAGNARSLDAEAIRDLAANPYPVFQLDASAAAGSSGSPLWDPVRGDVVGIINMVVVKRTRGRPSSEPTGFSFAVPIRHLRELLRSGR
ncbi:MAG: hypothetical protein OHK0026_04970 [Rhodocyclaceae bacterium]